MLEQFLNHIEKNKLADRDQRVLLAVSGGADSMVMLHLFHQAGFKIGVAHCNFRLRGKESDQDEQFVISECEKLDVKAHTKGFEVVDYQRETRYSIQMAARELRYQWFEELLENEDYDLIATAHHLGDNLETILMNLVKGSGLDGISGIKLKTGKIIRPLLFAGREQIEKYANENQIQWRDDSSNASDKYQRNFVRNNIVPLLRLLNPNIDETFYETSERLRSSWNLFDKEIERISGEVIEHANEQVHIDRNRLLELQAPGLLLWEMIKGYGFNYSQCKGVIEVGHQVGKVFYSKTHQLTIDRAKLILSKMTGASKLLHTITDRDQRADSALGSIVISIDSKSEQIDPSPETAELDVSKIEFPLTWRSWNNGDSFYPLGMEHNKKISDFLIDIKIPLPDKDKISVITNKDGDIVWLVGLRIDDRFKITENTDQVIRLKFEAR